MNTMGKVVKLYEPGNRASTLSFEEAKELFAKELTEKGKSSLTIKNYIKDVERFMDWYEERVSDDAPTRGGRVCDIGRITLKEYAEFLKTSGKVAPTTANRRIIALKQFFSFLHDKEHMLTNPSDDLSIKAIQKGNTPNWLSREEVSRIFNAIDREPRARDYKKARDKAIISILVNCGLRVNEICYLRISDIDFERGVLTVQSGKGSKYRQVPIGKATLAGVSAWLSYKYEGCESNELAASDYIFNSQRSDKLTPRGVQHLTEVLSEISGVEFSPHSLRHTYAKNLADSTGKLEIVANLCGHSNINTTKIYVTPSMKELKKAVEIVEFSE